MGVLRSDQIEYIINSLKTLLPPPLYLIEKSLKRPPPLKKIQYGLIKFYDFLDFMLKKYLKAGESNGEEHTLWELVLIDLKELHTHL